MTTIVRLVRHGQTGSNAREAFMGRSNEDLNETGYNQARRLSARLANRPIAAVYASPLKRAFMTASVIAEPHRIEVKAVDDFIEIDQGDWAGLPIKEISRKWPDLWKWSRTDPSDFTMPNGESFKEVTERSIRAFEQIVAENQGKQVVIASHEIVVKVLLIHALGATNSIYRRFDLDNTSLSTIQITDGKMRVAMLNDTSHLDGLK